MAEKNGRQQLIDLCQQMAEIIVLGDPDDEGMIEQLKRLLAQVSVLAAAGSPACADRARKAVDCFNGLAGDTDSKKKIYESLCCAVADLQILMNEEGGQEEIKDAGHESPHPPAKAAEAAETAETAQAVEAGPKPGKALPEDAAGTVIFDDPVFFAGFVAEAREHLDSIETKLLLLETSPGDSDAINSVFRSFHSIKGAAACLRLDSIRDFAHETEELLEELKHEKKISSREISMLFKSTDALRDMVEESAGARAGMRPKGRDESNAATVGPDDAQKRKTVATPVMMHETIRLDARRLDRLIDMIGELVVCESMVKGDPELRNAQSQAFERKLSQLDKITREIQSIGMSLRMVPLRATFQKMNRLARDLAVRSHKKIEFVTSGESTELDKSMVDMIGDPLLHLVRNMVDHGIEPEAQRIKAGKAGTGRIELRAYHKGSFIYIEISDDGRGLDYRAIAAKALERGLIASADDCSEAELCKFIFLPGFSTARAITDISGRGVGLDVVKRCVETLQGGIELRSVSGAGTTVALRLPLTLAIMDGLVVMSGAEDFIIPTLCVVRAVRIAPGSITAVLQRGEIMRHEDATIPVVRLSRLLGTRSEDRDDGESTILIIEEEGQRIGLVVDKLLGKQQFAIKKLSDGISHAAGVSGCAVMPDGSVGLILGAGDLIRAALAQTTDGISIAERIAV